MTEKIGTKYQILRDDRLSYNGETIEVLFFCNFLYMLN